MYAVFEVFLGDVVDGIKGFLGFGFVIAKQNFLNVRQTVAEEHVHCTEEANAAGALVEGGFGFGGFRVGADVEGLDFLAPVENRLGGFFEFARNGHGDLAEVDLAGRAADGDIITAFQRIAVAAECAGGFVDRDFGGTDDGRNAPCGLFGYFWSAVLFRFAQYARPSALFRSRSIRASILLCRRNDVDSRKQGRDEGNVLYETDGDYAADDEDAHSGEHKIRAFAPSDKIDRYSDLHF